MKQSGLCGFRNKGGCRILTVKKCVGDGCAFCKSESEIAWSNSAANKRLRSIDIDEQIYISRKYYSNEMPWLP